MSRILLDYPDHFGSGNQMSIELEKVDIERGFAWMPLPFPMGELRRLPLNDLAQVGDIIHIPMPERIGEKDSTPLQERDDGSQEDRQKDE